MRCESCKHNHPLSDCNACERCKCEIVTAEIREPNLHGYKLTRNLDGAAAHVVRAYGGQWLLFYYPPGDTTPAPLYYDRTANAHVGTSYLPFADAMKRARRLLGSFICADCRKCKPVSTDGILKGAGGTGYANFGKRKVCYDCCGERDRQSLRTEQKIVLYLVKRDGVYHVTNWPSTLDIEPYRVTVSDHNMAGRNGRTDVWFSFESRAWHGVNIGDNQLLRCNRLRS